MNNSAIERLAPLTGIAWFVLLMVGAVIIGLYDYLPSAESVVESLTDNSDQASAGAYIGGLIAFFLLWFAGSLRNALGEREEGRGGLSDVAFGGAVATALALAAAFAILSIAAQRAGADGGIGVAEAGTLYDLWSAITGLVVPICLAALVGAAGVVSLRTGAFPAWFGWVSVAIAFSCLSPFGYAAQVVAMVWVPVVSVWLYARGPGSTVAA